jgi:hypothetical protein
MKLFIMKFLQPPVSSSLFGFDNLCPREYEKILWNRGWFVPYRTLSSKYVYYTAHRPSWATNPQAYSWAFKNTLKEISSLQCCDLVLLQEQGDVVA